MSNGKQLTFLCAYGIYLLIGIYGALWVSDEFDRERGIFYAFFALPLGIFWPYTLFLYPKYWQERPHFRQFVLGLILVSFSWGGVLLVNAVSGSKPVTYTRLTKSRVEQRSLAVAYRRGSLGWLYRVRW
ncbi:MAG: hypothetical protein AB8G05_06960 [Oligoflexales bacterium]